MVVVVVVVVVVSVVVVVEGLLSHALSPCILQPARFPSDSSNRLVGFLSGAADRTLQHPQSKMLRQRAALRTVPVR